MEPVRGGSLANLPDDAKAVFEELHGGSPATYAIRYAAGFPGIMMVLSGMSSLEQMKENVSFMKDFRPLDEREMKAVEKVREIFRGKNLTRVPDAAIVSTDVRRRSRFRICLRA